MKALSLLQPWATLVVAGLKVNETRSWQTKYRGPLLIHASMGKKKYPPELQPWLDKVAYTMYLREYGAIIGRVNLIEIVPTLSLYKKDGEKITTTLSAQELAFGDYKPGRFAWIFEKPVIFDIPIPYKGQLSIWDANIIR